MTNDEIQRLIDERDRLRDSYNELRARYTARDDAECTVQEQAAELVNRDREVLSLKNALHSAEIDRGILDRMIDRRNRKIERLEAEVVQLREIQADPDGAKQETANLRGELAAANHEIKTLKANLEAAGTSMAQLHDTIDNQREQIKTLRALKPGIRAGEKVYPTLHMRDHRDYGTPEPSSSPFVAETTYLALPDGSVLPLAEDSSIVLSAGTKSPLTASVDLLIDGIEMGREA